MKLMFTSVGRRVELVQAFRRAAEKLKIALEIYGADITSTAPALKFCDHTIIVPKIRDEKYIPELKKICAKENIDALVPTIDTDLMILAQNRNDFGKTKVIISRPEKIAVCRDKRYTADYFNSLGLKSPYPVDNWKKYDSGYPAFIKPKDGSSSIYAYRVENANELKSFARQVPDYIIQPFIEGTEYTVDIFCDFDGMPIYVTPRIRLEVRAGEVLKTQMTHDKKIVSEIKRLISDFKPCGQITVQLIREKNTGEDWYIEINPRFGGGAPLTIFAGADSAEAMLRLLSGEKLKYAGNVVEDGVIYSRFDQSVRVK